LSFGLTDRTTSRWGLPFDPHSTLNLRQFADREDAGDQHAALQGQAADWAGGLPIEEFAGRIERGRS
jgi:hypothetical protein